MRRCKTCGGHLWIIYFLIGFPFQKRVKRFRDAEDCIDLLPKNWQSLRVKHLIKKLEGMTNLKWRNDTRAKRKQRAVKA